MPHNAIATPTFSSANIVVITRCLHPRFMKITMTTTTTLMLMTISINGKTFSNFLFVQLANFISIWLVCHSKTQCIWHKVRIYKDFSIRWCRSCAISTRERFFYCGMNDYFVLREMMKVGCGLMRCAVFEQVFDWMAGDSLSRISIGWPPIGIKWLKWLVCRCGAFWTSTGRPIATKHRSSSLESLPDVIISRQKLLIHASQHSFQNSTQIAIQFAFQISDGLKNAISIFGSNRLDK